MMVSSLEGRQGSSEATTSSFFALLYKALILVFSASSLLFSFILIEDCKGVPHLLCAASLRIAFAWTQHRGFIFLAPS